MRQRLHQFLRLVASTLALSVAALGHASAASAMPAMSGMEHGTTGSVCQVLCTSALSERQQVPPHSDVDDDDPTPSSTVSSASVSPFVPLRLAGTDRLSSAPPSKVPLYLRLQLLRV